MASMQDASPKIEETPRVKEVSSEKKSEKFSDQLNSSFRSGISRTELQRDLAKRDRIETLSDNPDKMIDGILVNENSNLRELVKKYNESSAPLMKNQLDTFLRKPENRELFLDRTEEQIDELYDDRQKQEEIIKSLITNKDEEKMASMLLSGVDKTTTFKSFGYRSYAQRQHLNKYYKKMFSAIAEVKKIDRDIENISETGDALDVHKQTAAIRKGIETGELSFYEAEYNNDISLGQNQRNILLRRDNTDLKEQWGKSRDAEEASFARRSKIKSSEVEALEKKYGMATETAKEMMRSGVRSFQRNRGVYAHQASYRNTAARVTGDQSLRAGISLRNRNNPTVDAISRSDSSRYDSIRPVATTLEPQKVREVKSDTINTNPSKQKYTLTSKSNATSTSKRNYSPKEQLKVWSIRNQNIKDALKKVDVDVNNLETNYNDMDPTAQALVDAILDSSNKISRSVTGNYRNYDLNKKTTQGYIANYERLGIRNKKVDKLIAETKKVIERVDGQIKSKVPFTKIRLDYMAKQRDFVSGAKAVIDSKKMAPSSIERRKASLVTYINKAREQHFDATKEALLNVIASKDFDKAGKFLNLIEKSENEPAYMGASKMAELRELLADKKENGSFLEDLDAFI